ncbi:MAG: hypothetical protein NW226_24360 [Microscillaceae bacterium]|nr:hypothetical protein [Microscillaceae bacterium]
MSIFVVGILMESFAAKPYERNWILIYENDAQGKCLYGDKKDLIRAIQTGNEIRIYWQDYDLTNHQIRGEHSASAKFLTIEKDHTIQAQIEPVVEQVLDFNQTKTNTQENLELSLIVSTSGKNEMISKNAQPGEFLALKTMRSGVKWFIKK